MYEVLQEDLAEKLAADLERLVEKCNMVLVVKCDSNLTFSLNFHKCSVTNNENFGI